MCLFSTAAVFTILRRDKLSNTFASAKNNGRINLKLKECAPLSVRKNKVHFRAESHKFPEKCIINFDILINITSCKQLFFINSIPHGVWKWCAFAVKDVPQFTSGGAFFSSYPLISWYALLYSLSLSRLILEALFPLTNLCIGWKIERFSMRKHKDEIASTISNWTIAYHTIRCAHRARDVSCTHRIIVTLYNLQYHTAHGCDSTNRIKCPWMMIN